MLFFGTGPAMRINKHFLCILQTFSVILLRKTVQQLDIYIFWGKSCARPSRFTQNIENIFGFPKEPLNSAWNGPFCNGSIDVNDSSEPKMAIKNRYFLKGYKQLFGTIDFHSRKKNTMEVNGAKVPIVFKISSFVFSKRKKLIQVWNNLRVSKWWQNFHFWVEYPFKSAKSKSIHIEISVAKKVHCLLSMVST